MIYDAEYYDNLIDCAAIKMPDGRVWTGKRHHHVMMTIIQATGEKAIGGIRGFVTAIRNDKYPQGRFVTRKEAFDIVKKTGQCMYSEDLY